MLFRFAVLPYANALPLVHCIPRVCPEAELVYRTPRQAIEALLTNRVDAALVPLIDHFRNPDVSTVTDLGICADGDVTSVLLQCRRPLREVRTVRPDPESRTSNVLVQILLADHFHVSPEILTAPEGPAADACVCIGDRALTGPPALRTYRSCGRVEENDRPAFRLRRVAGPAAPAQRRGDVGRAPCRQGGRLSVAHIAGRLAAARLNLSEDRCRDYLGRCLHYDLGPREHQAIDLFRRLAATGPCPDMNQACLAVSLEGPR